MDQAGQGVILMGRTEIRVESVNSFFERGRKLAKLADRGAAIPQAR